MSARRPQFLLQECFFRAHICGAPRSHLCMHSGEQRPWGVVDQSACKPGSVIGSHPSRIAVADNLQRSTRELGPAPSAFPV